MKTLLSIGLCFLTCAVDAQDPVWGKFTKEEHELSTYEQDPDASLVILQDFGRIQVNTGPSGYFFLFTQHRRMKILADPGKESADIQVPYYHSDDTESIERIRAQVFTPGTGIVKLTKQDFHRERINKYWSSVRFSFPNVQVGSIIEYEVSIRSDRLLELREWFFQHPEPVIQSTLVLTVPQTVSYMYLLQGKQAIQIQSKTRSVVGSRLAGAKEYVSRMTASHVPGYQAEGFITAMDNYRIGIRFQLQEIALPDGTVRTYYSDWQGTANRLNQMESVGKQYQKKARYKKLLSHCQPILAGTGSTREKLEAIHNLIVTSVKWNGIFSIQVDETLDKAFEMANADSGTLNMMMLAMMQKLGLDAHLALVSTRSNGLYYEEYPILEQFNHALVYWRDQEQDVFIDLGDRHRPFGLPRPESLNGRAWIADADDPRWLDLPSPKVSRLSNYELRLDSLGAFSGTVINRYNNYAATEAKHFSEEMESVVQSPFISVREQEGVTDYRIQSGDFLKEVSDTCSLNYTIDDFEEGTEIIYLQLPILSGFRNAPFKLTRRTYPIDFPFPFRESHIMQLHWPENMSIKAIPESMNLNYGESTCRFACDGSGDHQLNISFDLNIKRAHYSSAAYSGLKMFFEKIAEKLQESLVFEVETH